MAALVPSSRRFRRSRAPYASRGVSCTVAPGGVGQPDVDHGGGGDGVAAAAHRLPAAGGHRHVEALLGESALERAPQVAVVLGDRHAGEHAWMIADACEGTLSLRGS